MAKPAVVKNTAIPKKLIVLRRKERLNCGFGYAAID
jgi:hypothetical protein